jgi:GntR family transcriptional regulator, transcriptional repressor for pyruvate dehydrogenase complex
MMYDVRKDLNRMVRKKLSEEVSGGILDLIRSKQISPGQRLPTESEIADLFQVSRTAVREGVKSLIAVGFLETRPGIGTFVVDAHLGPLRDPNGGTAGEVSSQLLDLLEFRKIVEPEMSALAAERRSPEDLQELERCVEELAKGIRMGIRPAEDIGFHLALARASLNSAILDASYLIFRFYQNDPSLPDESDLAAHRSIYEAVRDGNPSEARQAMLNHFVILEQRYQLKVNL